MFTPLKRIIIYGFRNLKRQTGLNFVTVFVLFLTIFTLSTIFIFKGMTDYLISSIQKKIDVSIYLNTSVNNSQIEGLKKQLLDFPGVKEVYYVSSQEALKQFKEKHKNDPVIMQSLQEVGSNPLYPSINIKAEKASQYAAILSFLNKSSFKNIIQKVDYIKKKTLIEKLFSLTSSINMLGIILALIFGLATLLIALNSIRIAIKDASEEIGIMRLVGASNWYTRGPFIVQSIVWGIFAGLITFGTVFLLAYFGSPKILHITSGFNLFEWFGRNVFLLFCFQLGTGIILSVLASLIATRKFLKV